MDGDRQKAGYAGTNEPDAVENTDEGSRMPVAGGRGRLRLPLWARRTIDIGLWVIVLGLAGWRFGPQLMAATGVGDSGTPAPTFQVSTLDGQTIDLAGLRGNVVLVNFWATWCPPCRLEMPAFERVWRERRDDGLVVLGLSTDSQGPGFVYSYVLARGFSYPMAMAPARTVRDFGGVRALPMSFLIDRKGNIRHEVTGFFAEPALRAAVDRLLAESP